MRTKRERAMCGLQNPCRIARAGGHKHAFCRLCATAQYGSDRAAMHQYWNDIVAVSLADKTQYVSLSALTPEAHEDFHRCCHRIFLSREIAACSLTSAVEDLFSSTSTHSTQN